MSDHFFRRHDRRKSTKLRAVERFEESDAREQIEDALTVEPVHTITLDEALQQVVSLQRELSSAESLICHYEAAQVQRDDRILQLKANNDDLRAMVTMLKRGRR